jgi:hypothetical protein
MLLHWLANLSLIPFDITSMDSNVRSADRNGACDSGPALVTRIVEVCKHHLSDTGPTRDAAAVCLSALLTRPDMESKHLAEFMKWAIGLVNTWALTPSSERSALTSQYFQVLGVLHSMFRLYKLGHRAKLMPYSAHLLAYCVSLCHVTAQTAARKLLTKLVQRIGMNFLPPRVASWRYMRGSRSLNLQPAAATITVPLAAEQGSAATATVPGDGEQQQEEDDDEVPAELEEVLDCLLCSMRDRDTVVRWSAAKGIGRIAMRLPREHAADVVDAVLEAFSEEGADCSWHGGCLTVAELARRGLLLPDRLAAAIPFINRAIHFDVQRGQHSVGTHVRDAACYVCWAFSRAYSPTVMAPYIRTLTTALLVTALFDREVNCRRAASAAYQETVGRQGAQNVPHGIEILTVADYMSVGNRGNCFTSVAQEVAGLDDALPASFVEHLVTVTVRHWDREMRVLAAKALAGMVADHRAVVEQQLTRLIGGCTSSLLSLRHGSIVATAEVVFALTASGLPLSEEHLTSVLNIVPAVEKARLYKVGGELGREAVCGLISSIARSRLPMSVKQQVSLVEALNENFRQPFAPIRDAARDALRDFLFTHFAVGDTPSDRLQKLTVSKYLTGLRTESNVSATRGYALALGALPLRLLVLPEGRADAVLACLAECCSPQHRIGGEYDAETCCNSVAALVEVAERLCGAGRLSLEQARLCFTTLLASTEDYSVDNRGDTGSWSRTMAMKGMETLLYALLRCRAGSGGETGTSVVCSRGRGAVTDQKAAGQELRVLQVTYPPQSTAWHALSGAAEWVVLSEGVDSQPIEQSELVGAQFEELFTSTAAKVSGAVVKQLAEKLDAVREVAGGVLLRLLQRTAAAQGGSCDVVLPDQDFVLRVVAAAAGCERMEPASVQAETLGSRINWAQPTHVYPVVCALLDSPFFFTPVLAGLVVSVGGLTETTSKVSAQSLLEYCARCKTSIPSKLAELADALVDLMDRSKRLDRVVVPAVKTLILLVENGVLDSLAADKRAALVARLQAVLNAETRGSTVLSKVRLAVELHVRLLSLLKGDVEAHRLALLNLLPNLTHRFPVVRKCKKRHSI